MKIRLSLLGLDLAIQATLISLVLLTLLSEFIFQQMDTFYVGILGLLLIGPWQMVSVFIKALLMRRNWQVTYLFSAIVYLMFMVFISKGGWSFLPAYSFIEKWGFLVWLPTIPSVAALSYFYLSWLDFQAVVFESEPDLV